MSGDDWSCGPLRALDIVVRVQQSLESALKTADGLSAEALGNE
jgi:hypothetical protein